MPGPALSAVSSWLAESLGPVSAPAGSLAWFKARFQQYWPPLQGAYICRQSPAARRALHGLDSICGLSKRSQQRIASSSACRGFAGLPLASSSLAATWRRRLSMAARAEARGKGAASQRQLSSSPRHRKAQLLASGIFAGCRRLGAMASYDPSQIAVTAESLLQGTSRAVLGCGVNNFFKVHWAACELRPSPGVSACDTPLLS